MCVDEVAANNFDLIKALFLNGLIDSVLVHLKPLLLLLSFLHCHKTSGIIQAVAETVDKLVHVLANILVLEKGHETALCATTNASGDMQEGRCLSSGL